jgi:hypothetical protein
VEKQITVQHVSVQDGGRAIVGNITHAPGAPPPEKALPPALADARIAPMAMIEGNKELIQKPVRRRSK